LLSGGRAFEPRRGLLFCLFAPYLPLQTRLPRIVLELTSHPLMCFHLASLLGNSAFSCVILLLYLSFLSCARTGQDPTVHRQYHCPTSGPNSHLPVPTNTSVSYLGPVHPATSQTTKRTTSITCSPQAIDSPGFLVHFASSTVFSAPH
jgi:hypothetical protein